MTFLLASSVIFFFLMLAYFTGALLFSFSGCRENKNLSDFFFRTITGFCFIVMLYAIVKSGGKTSLILLLIPGVIFWMGKKQLRTNSLSKGILPPIKWPGLSVLIILPVVFFLQHFFESTTMQEDSANYLKIAEALRLTGAENTRHFRNVYSELFHGMEPYHYFEMWLGAMYMDLTQGIVSHMNCMRVCSYGSIIALSILGLICVCENIYGRITWHHILVAVLFLFFIPNISQLFFNYDRHFNYPIECNPINRINFRTYWLFFIPSLILMLRKEYFFATIALFVLPAISITTLPGIFGSIGLLILANRWTKFYTQKENYRIVGYLISFVVVLVLLFKIFKMRNVEALYSYSTSYILNYYHATWKAILFTIFMEAVNLIFVFGPFLLIILFIAMRGKSLRSLIKENTFLIVFALFLNSAGIVLFQCASFMNNAYQFAFIGFNVLALLFFTLFQLAMKKIEKPLVTLAGNILLIVFLLFSAYRLTGVTRKSLFAGQDTNKPGYHLYDASYLQSIRDVMKENNCKPGGYIGDSAYYKGLYYSKRLPDFYFPGCAYFIFSISDDAYQYCLSDTNAIYYGYNGTDRDFKFLRQAVRSSIFHMDFYKENSVSVGEKRRDAIEKYHLGYMILSKGAFPDKEWEPLIEKAYSDSNSGETFLVLKQN